MELPEDEANHLTSVLRMRDGDPVEVLDGQGKYAAGKLVFARKRVFVEIGEVHTENEPLLPAVLESAVLKGDAMDWLIEKCVELGMPHFQPVVTAHTVVRLQERKGPEAFRDRWQRIADQALKQCGRRTRMLVELPISLEELLSKPLGSTERRLWLDEGSRSGTTPHLAQAFSQGPSFRILLGPEGGFSQGEREMLTRSDGILPVSLGPWILRAETAGIAAVSQLSAHMALLTARGKS
jgi:16S rRNA (uracil1498-N3)-methyltransferase